MSGLPSPIFCTSLALMPFDAQDPAGALGGVYVEAHGGDLLGHEDDVAPHAVAHADEHRAGAGQVVPCRLLRLCKCKSEILVEPHDLAGRFHFRPEDDVGARELVENGSTDSLTAK